MSGSLATNRDAKGNGLTAADYRKILSAFYPSGGIVNGGIVTGNSGLTYHVPDTVAVIPRGSDGTRLVTFDGGDTDAVTAGDATYRRIDTVWIKADDPALDAGSNVVHVGVTSGTPSASPVAPKLDSGQLGLMDKLVQSGATNLNTGSGDNRSINYAIPYGGAVGMLGEAWLKYDGTGSSVLSQHFYEQPITFTIPTDRIVEFRFWTNISSKEWQGHSDWAMQFQVDGTGLDHAASLFSAHGAWQSFESSYNAIITAGTHTARIDSWLVNGSAPVFHYNGDSEHQPLWVGRRFQIWDRGVAQ